MQKLISDVSWDLSDKLDELVRQIRAGDYLAAFNNIKEMKYNLQRVDTRLEDCNTILAGYLTVLKNIADEAATETEHKGGLDLGGPQQRPDAVETEDDSND